MAKTMTRTYEYKWPEGRTVSDTFTFMDSKDREITVHKGDVLDIEGTSNGEVRGQEFKFIRHHQQDDRTWIDCYGGDRPSQARRQFHIFAADRVTRIIRDAETDDRLRKREKDTT